MVWKRKNDEKPEMPVELMSYDQLLALKVRVDQELAGRGDGELKALKEKLLLIADAQGVAVADLFGIRAPRKGREHKKPRAKYRDPETGESWSGRGKRPAWVQVKLDAGHSLEDLAAGAVP